MSSKFYKRILHNMTLCSLFMSSCLWSVIVLYIIINNTTFKMNLFAFFYSFAKSEGPYDSYFLFPLAQRSCRTMWHIVITFCASSSLIKLKDHVRYCHHSFCASSSWAKLKDHVRYCHHFVHRLCRLFFCTSIFFLSIHWTG